MPNSTNDNKITHNSRNNRFNSLPQNIQYGQNQTQTNSPLIINQHSNIQTQDNNHNPNSMSRNSIIHNYDDFFN